MMPEAPRFFVPTIIPAVKADNQESAYAELARWCGRQSRVRVAAGLERGSGSL